MDSMRARCVRPRVVSCVPWIVTLPAKATVHPPVPSSVTQNSIEAEPEPTGAPIVIVRFAVRVRVTTLPSDGSTVVVAPTEPRALIVSCPPSVVRTNVPGVTPVPVPPMIRQRVEVKSYWSHTAPSGGTSRSTSLGQRKRLAGLEVAS